MILNPYTAFSEVYDRILEHVDYEEWYSYIRELMHEYVKRPEWILELGCGTGKFGAKFSRDDYLIFGMDKSIDMLKIARARAYKKFHIFCGDMTNFTLSRKFDFIFSVHDTMNYFTEYDDLKKVLRSVKKIMKKNSIFMFDLTTEHNIKKYFYNNKTKYRLKGIDIEWKNNYDEKNKLIYSILQFKKNGKLSTEKHVQRVYLINEIKNLLEDENFKLIDIFSDYSFSPVQEDTVMTNYVTKLS
ncbi:MAG: class I SAM-dependent methyltransferase [Spirochaetes bacterium]|nr:class I SAM-dependent methyltransferase [Spirochaetota bacterium]